MEPEGKGGSTQDKWNGACSGCILSLLHAASSTHVCLLFSVSLSLDSPNFI